MKQFSALVRITIQHAFYANNAVKDLVLVPSLDTQKTMQRLDLQLHNNGSEHILAYGKETWKPAVLSHLDQPVVLRFVLRSTNPWFYNITDLPFPTQATQKLHFTNLRDLEAGASSIALSKTEKASAQDMIDQDLGLAPGDLGVIDLYVGRGEFMLAPPTEANATPILYHLQFGARHTRWRYYFISKSQPEVSVHLVKNLQSLLQASAVIVWGDKLSGDSAGTADQTVEVEEEAPRTLGGSSQTAVPVSLKEALPMSEISHRKPQIKLTRKNNTGTASPHTVTIALPTPDWRQIAPEQRPTGLVVFSEMYIYL